MAEVSLPMEMQYFPPSVAARARSYRQSIVPVNAPPYKPTERVRIVLGTTPGTYLNTAHSYLEFEIENTAPANDAATRSFRIDKHASAFIDRIEIYHAGALLDTVASANVLYSTLLDTTVSTVDLGTTHVVAGCESQVGEIVGRVVPAGSKIRVCMPLIGLLSPAGLSRYLPLGDAVNGNIEIDLYLAPALQPVRATNGAGDTGTGLVALDWQLNNVQYMAQLVEIDSAVHAALMQSIGGIYTLPYNSWRTYTCPIPANSTSYTHYIPTKVSSLSGVIVQLRDTAVINSSTAYGISTRSRGSAVAQSALRSAQLRVGALNFPLKPVDCSTEGFDEVLIESLKMFGRLGTSMGGTNMDRTEYGTSKFFIGFDTQAYSAASAAVDDGVQAQHGSTYLQLEFGSSSSLQMDICILFDGMLTVANGAISAAF